MADKPKTISRSEILGHKTPRDDAKITNVEQLSSYNWIESSSPTIAVPGSPALWLGVKPSSPVAKDSGLVYINQNAARNPSSPLEPLFRAIQTTAPEFSLAKVDLVSDRNCLRKLLAFIDPSLEKHKAQGSFKIKAEVVPGSATVLFQRDEAKVSEFISPAEFRGYGHSFVSAYTAEQVPGSTGHHRIVAYTFGGLKCVIRHETDGSVKTNSASSGKQGVKAGKASEAKDDEDGLSSLLDSLAITKKPSSVALASSKLKVLHKGNQVPLSSTLEIKTKTFRNPILIDDAAAQLYISQTPKLVRALHQSGRFDLPKVEDVTSDINAWETRNQLALSRLAKLLEDIVFSVKQLGRATISYVGGMASVVIEAAEKDRKALLPDDVYEMWKDAEESDEVEADQDSEDDE